MRGQNLTRQVAPDASFPLSVPVDDAWPNRLNRFTGSCKSETMSSAFCLSIVRKFLIYRCRRDLVLGLEGGNPSASDKLHTSGRIGLESSHVKPGRSDSGPDSPPQACSG